MALDAAILRAFSSGELAPSVGGRADLELYTRGARTIRNFVVRRQGGVVNRPGFAFVAAAKTTGKTFLFPFVFAAANASYIIEAGENYFRFHKDGAPVLDGGVPVEIVTPYSVGEFEEPAPLCFSQSGGIITITGLGQPPRELVYGGNGVDWVLRDVSTEPSIDPPTTGLGLTGAVAGAGYRAYVVTAISDTTPADESIASEVVESLTTIEPTTEDPIAFAWDAVAGASGYKVYLDTANNGVFGFIGRTPNATFNDTGLAPDYLDAPPEPRVLFTTALNYPAVNTTYQQRRFFAGTHVDREMVWASRVGLPSNFSIRTPLQDDDAVTWRLASTRIQPVMHLVGLDRLVALTDTGIWLIYGDADGSITPTRINLDQKGYLGANHVPPVVIGERIVYVQARGSRLRDLFYKREVSGYEGMGSRDLTVLAGHLFDGHWITSLAYAHEPHGIVWATRADGALLGCTYLADDDTFGWHRHDTVDGAFESVCVIPEGREDRVYAVVAREVDGSTVRYIERLASRQYDDVADAVFVDSAVTYDGAATTAISGLDHLEGASVMALADGLVQGPFTVSGGAITLTTAASVVQAGLAIEADLELLDLDVQGTDLRARRKTVQAVQLLLEQSGRGFLVGPDEDHLLAHRAEPWDTSALADGIEDINITGAFRPTGRVFIRHSDPSPLAINAVIPVFEAGS